MECYAERWLGFFPVILAVLLGFTVALPGVISLFLFVHRKELYSTSVFQTLGWLYQPFVRGAEFWQVHDVLLKMVLTGMLICKFKVWCRRTAVLLYRKMLLTLGPSSPTIFYNSLLNGTRSTFPAAPARAWPS